MAFLRMAALAIALASSCVANQPALSHFDGDGLKFDYPSSWNAARFDITSSFSYTFVYLSTDALTDPCERTSTSIACNRNPIDGGLSPSGIFVSWTSNGWPGWTFDSTVGESIRVGNVQSALEVNQASPGCLTMAGQTQVRVIIPSVAAGNWTEMDACINGPFAGSVESQVRAMLNSVEWHQAST